MTQSLRSFSFPEFFFFLLCSFCHYTGPLLYYHHLKMSGSISLFIVCTSDWPTWYHFKAACTNVKGLEVVLSVSLCILYPLCLDNPEIIHTPQKPAQWIVLIWTILHISLISLVRHHLLGAGKLLHQSREILGCWWKCLRDWMLISVTLPIDQQYWRIETSTAQWTIYLSF